MAHSLLGGVGSKYPMCYFSENPMSSLLEAWLGLSTAFPHPLSLSSEEDRHGRVLRQHNIEAQSQVLFPPNPYPALPGSLSFSEMT